MEDLVDCDGTDAGIIAALQCTVPMTTFTSTYGLSVGDLIIATVEANNAKGFSIPSSENVAGELAKSSPNAPSTPTRGATTSTT